VKSPLGSYEVASFGLWPENPKGSAVLLEDDIINVSKFATSSKPLTLAVKYEFTSTEGKTRQKQDDNFLVLGQGGSGARIISSTTPAGKYKFTALKTSEMKEWIILKNQKVLSIKPAFTEKLDNPVIEYLNMGKGKSATLKMGDQYAVKVLNGSSRTPLTNVILDAVYMSTGSADQKIAQKWVRLNSDGIGLVTVDPEMSAGRYNIISVKIHEI